MSLFVKFSRTENIQYLGGKNRKIWKIEKLREKNVEKLDEKLSDKNDPNSSNTSTTKSAIQSADAYSHPGECVDSTHPRPRQCKDGVTDGVRSCQCDGRASPEVSCASRHEA